MIPVMDDPLGKHWEQPKDIRSAEMDDTHVLLTFRQMMGLHEYSSTFPSGVYPGKCWKRLQKGTWLLVWYGDETPEHNCPILFREVLVVPCPASFSACYSRAAQPRRTRH